MQRTQTPAELQAEINALKNVVSSYQETVRSLTSRLTALENTVAFVKSEIDAAHHTEPSTSSPASTTATSSSSVDLTSPFSVIGQSSYSEMDHFALLMRPPSRATSDNASLLTLATWQTNPSPLPPPFIWSGQFAQAAEHDSGITLGLEEISGLPTGSSEATLNNTGNFMPDLFQVPQPSPLPSIFQAETVISASQPLTVTAPQDSPISTITNVVPTVTIKTEPAAPLTSAQPLLVSPCIDFDGEFMRAQYGEQVQVTSAILMNYFTNYLGDQRFLTDFARMLDEFRRQLNALPPGLDRPDSVQFVSEYLQLFMSVLFKSMRHVESLCAVNLCNLFSRGKNF